MALLRKISIAVLTFMRNQEFMKMKASTLIETLVASVIIITVFAITSLTLNNIFKSSIKNDTHIIDTELNKLLYLYQHHKIDKDYQNTFENWDISFSLQTEDNTTFVIAEAVQINKGNKEKVTTKIVTRKLIYEITK